MPVGGAERGGRAGGVGRGRAGGRDRGACGRGGEFLTCALIAGVGAAAGVEGIRRRRWRPRGRGLGPPGHGIVEEAKRGQGIEVADAVNDAFERRQRLTVLFGSGLYPSGSLLRRSIAAALVQVPRTSTRILYSDLNLRHPCPRYLLRETLGILHSVQASRLRGGRDNTKAGISLAQDLGSWDYFHSL